MMRTMAAVGFVVAVVACSSSSTTGQSGPCAQRSGTYSTNYTTRGGNCGDIPENVSSLTEQPTGATLEALGCAKGASIAYSADNCIVTFDSNCPTTDKTGNTVTERGKATWNKDGSEGSSTEQFTLQDKTGKVLCTGTYDAKIRRL